MRRARAPLLLLLLLPASTGCVLLVGSYDKVEAGTATGGDPGLRVDAAVDAAALDGARDAGHQDAEPADDGPRDIRPGEVTTDDALATDCCPADGAAGDDGGAQGEDAAREDATAIDAAGALGQVQWLRTFGSTADGGVDSPGALAVTNTGDVYFTAEFNGDVQLGSDLRQPSGTFGLLLAKYDRDGTYGWSRVLGARTPGQPQADKGQFFVSSLALDFASRPVVGGTVDGQIDLGAGLESSAGYPDVFLEQVAADNSGIGWGFKAGNQDSQLGRSIAFGGGSIALTGYFNGVLILDTCPQLNSSGTFDLVVARFSAAGDCQWSQRFGGGANTLGLSVALDDQGRMALAGEHLAELDLGGHVLVASSPTAEHFVAWLGTSGTVLHARALDTRVDAPIALAMDSDGALFVAGTRASGEPVRAHALVRQFNADRSVGWEVPLAGSGVSSASAVDVDAQGRVLVTGSFAGQLRLGALEQTSDDANDAFVALLDGASGSALGLVRIGGAGDQGGVAIRHEFGGGVVVLGAFASEVFDGQQSVASLGGVDVFVARLAP